MSDSQRRGLSIRVAQVRFPSEPAGPVVVKRDEWFGGEWDDAGRFADGVEDCGFEPRVVSFQPVDTFEDRIVSFEVDEFERSVAAEDDVAFFVQPAEDSDNERVFESEATGDLFGAGGDAVDVVVFAGVAEDFHRSRRRWTA